MGMGVDDRGDGSGGRSGGGEFSEKFLRKFREIYGKFPRKFREIFGYPKTGK